MGDGNPLIKHIISAMGQRITDHRLVIGRVNIAVLDQRLCRQLNHLFPVRFLHADLYCSGLDQQLFNGHHVPSKRLPDNIAQLIHFNKNSIDLLTIAFIFGINL
ncbi:hypothetical protein D3C71_1842420 [compost metagenome]